MCFLFSLFFLLRHPLCRKCRSIVRNKDCLSIKVNFLKYNAVKISVQKIKPENQIDFYLCTGNM